MDGVELARPVTNYQAVLPGLRGRELHVYRFGYLEEAVPPQGQFGEWARVGRLALWSLYDFGAYALINDVLHSPLQSNDVLYYIVNDAHSQCLRAYWLGY